MLKLAVLASGNGSNLQAIIDSIKQNRLSANIIVVISDRNNAYALERARLNQIPDYLILPKQFSSRTEHEKAIISRLDKYQPDLIVLAGYMRLLTPYFIRYYPHKIINIHPALLPAFPGTHAIQQAYDYGVKITGITVHFVDEGVDTGPIIAQTPVEISDLDTLESLEEKIHQQEHCLYPRVLQWFSENRVTINGRKVLIAPANSP